MGLTFSAYVVAILCLLALQWRLSSGFSPTASVLLKLQAIYWGLSYIGRSIYLWHFEPVFGEVLFDSRLAMLGYDRVLLEILPYALLGQAAFILGLLVCHRFRGEGHGNEAFPSQKNRAIVPVVVTFLILGWLGRLGSYGGVGVASYLLPFSAFAAAAAVLFLPFASRAMRILIVVSVVGELGWSIIGASKTPVLGILTAILIKLTLAKGRSAVLKAVPSLAVIGAIVFAVIQPLKGIETTSRAVSEQNMSPAVAMMSSVLQRTDVTTPMADALFYRPKPWLSAAEYSWSVFTGILPTGLHEAVGVRWTREVKTDSFGDQFQDVFIASGVVAEGMVQGGIVGVIIECSLLAIITLAIGASIQSSRLPVAMAACVFAFDSALYEGGFLWIAESGSGAVQTALITSVVVVLVGGPPSRVNGIRLNRGRLSSRTNKGN